MRALWAVRAPSGALMPETISQTSRGAYFALFNSILSHAEQSRYWHRAEAAQAAYKRRGYRAVRVKLELADGGEGS